MPSPGAGPSSFVVPRTPRGGGGFTKKHGIIAGVAAGTMIAVLLVLRTVLSLSGRPAEVSGHVVSEHLGVTMELAETWTHEPSKDDESSKLGFRRATSTYFQGVTPEDFLMQMTLVTLTPEEHPATDEDVRRIGQTEILQSATDRTCGPLAREGTVIRCVAKTTYKARSFAVLEEYFLAGSRVVFARALVEALVEAPTDAPKPGEIIRAGAREKPPIIAVVDEAKIQAILDSIEAK